MQERPKSTNLLPHTHDPARRIAISDRRPVGRIASQFTLPEAKSTDCLEQGAAFPLFVCPRNHLEHPNIKHGEAQYLKRNVLPRP